MKDMKARRAVPAGNIFGIYAVTAEREGQHSNIGMATASGLHIIHIPDSHRDFVIEQLTRHRNAK